MKYEQFSDFILIKMKPNEMTDKLEQKQVKDLPWNMQILYENTFYLAINKIWARVPRSGWPKSQFQNKSLKNTYISNKILIIYETKVECADDNINWIIIKCSKMCVL